MHSPVTRITTVLRRFAAPVAVLLALTTQASAAEWYLKQNQPASNSWNTLADWTANPDGTGANPTSISPSDTFDTNNRTLRTPSGATHFTFGGSLLRLRGTSSVVALKTLGTAVATVPKIHSTGGTIATANTGTQYVRIDDLENAATGHTAFQASSVNTLHVSVGKLTGSGETRIQGGGTLLLSFTDAERYLGVIRVTGSTLGFNNNVFTSGPLVVENSGRIVLDRPVSFAGLVVGGTEYSTGTYSYATLQATHPAIFVSGGVDGSVTVRAPRIWYLTNNQGISQNWTETFLSDWNSAANGSGVAPTSINGYDTYVNQVANRLLRTPNVASSFGGGALVVSNSARLVIKTPAAVTTIPVLVTGNATIVNSYGNVRQDLDIGDWSIGSGLSRIAALSGQSLAFSIDHLTGSGTLQTQDGGGFYLSLTDGLGYTGTLNHLSGSLRFESLFATAGSFNVGSSATVHLDKPAYFTAFNVAGTAKAGGFHSYASLNAAHPARFPSGSSSGFVAVYSPDTAGPPHMFGVNLAGGEFGNIPGTYGYDYIYPSAAAFDYYNSKGLKLIRLPFKWERLQLTLNGSLNTAELARIDTVVGYASARGMKVILDMHNYAYRKESGTVYLIGTGPVTLSAFGDVWLRIADHYKTNPAIYGYGIMNEPNATGGTWPTIAQTAVNAIRQVDLGHHVIVGGDSWSNAVGWRAKNPNLDIQDPVGRLIYEAHCYFDNDNSGTYNQTYDGEGAYPMIGVDRATEFVGWLQERGAKGFIGEYGVPNNDSRWNVVLDNFLAYLDANGVSGTYWAGGPWWGSYPLSCEPTNNYTVDKPQMSVLQNYE
ncbi:MAG: glycoside hydrolase family 5 protein [Opitutaceae bacterium]|jgi:endoglucanase